MSLSTGTLAPGQLSVKVTRFSRLQVREKEFGGLEGGGMQTLPEISFRQGRISFPFLTPASCFSAMPWKSGPKELYQTAITTCCVISFKVTLGYNLIPALHSFGRICVFSRVHSVLLMPATETPDLEKM